MMISGVLGSGPVVASEIPHPSGQSKPAADLPLSEALRLLPANRLLELTLPEGQFARGYAVQVSNDTLHLRQDNNKFGPVTRYPLADILRCGSGKTTVRAAPGRAPSRAPWSSVVACTGKPTNRPTGNWTCVSTSTFRGSMPTRSIASGRWASISVLEFESRAG